MRVKPVSFDNESAYFKLLGGSITSTQYIREFIVNMIENGATQGFVGFCMRKVAGTARKVRKMTFSDNGVGMNGVNLKGFIGKMAASSGTIARGQNHGIGAKISAAFRNKLGILFQSWTDPTDPKEEGNMVSFAYDPGRQEYGLETYDNGEVVDCPEISKNQFKKRFLSQNRGEIKCGTTVTLLGNAEDEDTSRPPEGWKGIHTQKQKDSMMLLWLHNVISWRFWEFPANFELRVQRPKGEGPMDESFTNTNGGMRQYVEKESEARGKVDVPGGVCRWWLLKDPSITKQKKSERSAFKGKKGSRKSDPRYGIVRGFAMLHRNEKYGYTEMYEPKIGTQFLRQFGFNHIAARLVVMFEPFNAAPDDKRLHLCSKSTGENLFSSGAVMEAIHWFSHPDNQPKALLAAEAKEDLPQR